MGQWHSQVTNDAWALYAFVFVVVFLGQQGRGGGGGSPVLNRK